MKTSIRLMLVTVLGLLLTGSTYAVSTGNVIGQVTNKDTKLAYGNAMITFENRMDRIEVQADEHGHYLASHLPTGKYQMRVVYNNRTFVMNDVHVYDSYTTEVNFTVSNDSTLPPKVVMPTEENLFSSVTSNDIVLTNSKNNQPSQRLNDVLSQQPGVDIRGGRIFIKGSDQVKIFIDGTPVMGQPMQNRVW
ncbi:MAG TPA: Plug domain-containing protein [Chitinophagales bacterium]|nr:Plug domain-containing protein [Chitinophagales bacterium]